MPTEVGEPKAGSPTSTRLHHPGVDLLGESLHLLGQPGVGLQQLLETGTLGGGDLLSFDRRLSQGFPVTSVRPTQRLVPVRLPGLRQEERGASAEVLVRQVAGYHGR